MLRQAHHHDFRLVHPWALMLLGIAMEHTPEYWGGALEMGREHCAACHLMMKGVHRRGSIQESRASNRLVRCSDSQSSNSGETRQQGAKGPVVP
ncbi:MAG: hypothetical protein AAFQ89_13750 [Cyanobacteria bacterium J06626_18]